MKLVLTGFISLAALLLAASTLAGVDHYRGEGHMMITPDELEWGPVGSMGEGAEIAIIEGDLSNSEPFTFRLRLEDGYRILPHIHPAYERVTVLQGTLHFAHGREFDKDTTRTLPVGSVAIMPPGDPMFGYAEGETIIQLHGTGPWGIEYINPEDDPRNH
ncbi:cupin domain-containing protein [Wenzhouxiangella sp. AB-CW3]|uniref:cupin domain-containing protein n=1 Tax=Wenzhouxiangella sp. AB-CW3 TaxID=2771012 RepID=UPI00168BD7BB|nr:cupin domain-containing protein [Wenzhouxiangella sp. AB-CW3]QOC24068.1 cupin domain-containing protein [Wenzhouxiangella sp. AB-CW3]